jgi:DNA-binding MurR/RpiR family transcriptional regulator
MTSNTTGSTRRSWNGLLVGDRAMTKPNPQPTPKMKPTSVAELVREKMSELAPSERRVAQVLLASYPMPGLESLAQVAGSASVTPTTALRFVRKLGFDGYPDFQRKLREEVRDRMRSPLSLYAFQMPDPKDGVLADSLRVFRRGLEKTFRSVPESEFQAVVRLLADEQRPVVFTGGRFSQLLAHYAYAHLRMVRSGCALVGSTFDPREDAVLDIGRRHVACIFDYRRYQEDTIEFARAAAARGATVIAFTDPWLSPISTVAQRVLIAYPDAPSPFDSMVGAFALMEAVLAGVVAELRERGRTRVERLEAVRHTTITDAPGSRRRSAGAPRD